MSDMNTVCGKTMKLNVTVHSKAPLQVNWYKNDQPVDTKDGFNTSHNNELYSLLKEDITQVRYCF